MAASPTPTPAPSPRGAPSPLLNPRLGITVNSLGSSHRRKGEGKTRGPGLSRGEGGKQLPTASSPRGPSVHRLRTRGQSTCLLPPPPFPAAWPTYQISRGKGGRGVFPSRAPTPLIGTVLRCHSQDFLGQSVPRACFRHPPLLASCGAVAPRTRVSTKKAFVPQHRA